MITLSKVMKSCISVFTALGIQTSQKHGDKGTARSEMCKSPPLKVTKSPRFSSRFSLQHVALPSKLLKVFCIVMYRAHCYIRIFKVIYLALIYYTD